AVSGHVIDGVAEHVVSDPVIAGAAEAIVGRQRRENRSGQGGREQASAFARVRGRLLERGTYGAVGAHHNGAALRSGACAAPAGEGRASAGRGGEGYRLREGPYAIRAAVDPRGRRGHRAVSRNLHDQGVGLRRSRVAATARDQRDHEDAGKQPHATTLDESRTSIYGAGPVVHSAAHDDHYGPCRAHIHTSEGRRKWSEPPCKPGRTGRVRARPHQVDRSGQFSELRIFGAVCCLRFPSLSGPSERLRRSSALAATPCTSGQPAESSLRSVSGPASASSLPRYVG